MCTHATSRIWETSCQNRQILKNLLGNIEIFCLLKSNFPHTKFDFLQQLSAFFNGFQLSSTAFQFSSTAFWFSSKAFRFPRNPRKSIYNDKYTKDHYLSFVFFATRSSSFVISATMPTSHPTISIIVQHISTFVLYITRRHTTLTPTNEESAWAQWEKKTI